MIMISSGRITKKEQKEVQGIVCMECGSMATYYVSAGGDKIDGVTIDLCNTHFKVLQRKIATIKLIK